MIEAVNSVIANAQALRASAEVVDAARSFAANPERTQQASVSVPQAPYISPYIHLDLDHDIAVLQIRDSETGDVVRQFPTEAALRVRGAGTQQQQSGEERVSPVQIQDVNVPQAQPAYTPQNAIAALSTGAQTGQLATSSGTISVFA